MDFTVQTKLDMYQCWRWYYEEKVTVQGIKGSGFTLKL